MTDTSEMVERVAMAIAIKDITRCGANTKDARQRIIRGGGPAPIYIRQARAAIEAMREPTTLMLNAATDFTEAGLGMSWINRSPQTLFYQAWQSQIDAALIVAET